MTLFLVLAAALLAVAMWIVGGAAWRHRAAAEAPSAAQANIDALRGQLKQLDADLAAGTLDAAAHARSRDEVARRLLADTAGAETSRPSGPARGTRVLLFLAVPILSVALYAVLGSPAALSPQASTRPPTQQDVEAMVARLAERMEKLPPGRAENLEGWVMLGRSYAVLQRYPEAARAFAQALQLAPDDPRLLVDRAQALAMAQGQDLQGEPLRLIERALTIDPKNPNALALAGSAAFARKDYAAAAAYWQRAQPAAEPGGEFAKGLEQSIAEAQALAGSTQGRAAAAAPAAAIRGRVSVAPALASRIAPGDTVFVFARAAQGPRMPLAIVKRSAADLPFDFTLDDSQAMAPGLELSAHPQVVVGVRVSKSGNATPSSGDLEGETGPVPNHGGPVELKIEHVRP